MKTKILDCTLRDGGYYTQWDFSPSLVKKYVEKVNNLPIEFLEVGLRTLPQKGYHGKFYYLPTPFLKELSDQLPNKKLVVLIDKKNIQLDSIDRLLEGLEQSLYGVRLAVKPNEEGFENLNKIIAAITAKGLKVYLNFMYLSKWCEDQKTIQDLAHFSSQCEAIYLVDSFGSVTPTQLKQCIQSFRQIQKDIKLGFHGHNNLELATANSIVALEEELDYIDGTILGMGRGAGNLKTELFMSYLNANGYVKFELEELAELVEAFEDLKTLHNWGPHFPYNVSGAYDLPQAEIMDLLSKKRYNYPTIISKLGTTSEKKSRPISDLGKVDKILVLGAGPTVSEHKDALERYIAKHDKIALVHASFKSYNKFCDLNIPQYVAIAGDASGELVNSKHYAISLSQNQAKMENCKYISFTSKTANEDSPLAIAFHIFCSLNAKSKEIVIAGFDGYAKNPHLYTENQLLLNEICENGYTLNTLTPTNYQNILQDSVYKYLV